MKYYSEIGKPHRRPIVISKLRPSNDKGMKVISKLWGLAVNDFVWITCHGNWRHYVKGVSRNTLVLDPYNLTGGWWGENGENEFAGGIRAAFDNIVTGSQCVPALAEWSRLSNPPIYARMTNAQVN